MSRIVRAAAVAAAASLASWYVTRWLERRALRSPRPARAIQVWENEGGNPAPQALQHSGPPVIEE
jgi:hypothetical protein